MSANADTGKLSGYGELIRTNANFRQLWLGQIVSLLGDWFDLIASATLIGELTGSGLAVGGLFVVRMLAPFLVSPLAGVAADRYNRKHLLIIADLSRALIVLGFLLVRRPQDVWFLYVVTALQLGLSGLFFPARNAILPDIVNRRELGAANTISSATWSVMLAFGAALGGFVAGQWGAYPSFIVDSLSFVGSAVLISGVRYTHVPPLEGSDTSVAAGVRQYVAGLRYLGQNRDILAIALHKSAYGLLVAGGFQVVQVALAEQVYVIGKGGGTSLGLLYTAVGIGTGLGPFAARVFTGDRDKPQRVAIAASYGITALGLAAAAPLLSFGVVLFGAFLRGLGTGIGWVFSTQLLLMLLPDKFRGRVFSSEFALQTLGNAMGAMAGGAALDASPNLSLMLWVMAGLIIIPGVLWALWVAFGTLAKPPVIDDEGGPGGALPVAEMSQE